VSISSLVDTIIVSTLTPTIRSSLIARPGGPRRRGTQHFGGATSLGRPGQPAELASIYVQLAVNDASFATGQVYGASGGGGQP
jgi:NAD(P)-dependent dehydrogenase (short-subunit alcohol dehydrogenase family)